MGTGALEDTGGLGCVSQRIPSGTHQNTQARRVRAWGLGLPLGRFHGGNQPL
jgi:hypothetical protein